MICCRLTLNDFAGFKKLILVTGCAAPKMTIGNEAAIKLLAETKCGDLVKGHPVIEIDGTASVAKACSVNQLRISCLFHVLIDTCEEWD